MRHAWLIPAALAVGWSGCSKEQQGTDKDTGMATAMLMVIPTATTIMAIPTA